LEHKKEFAKKTFSELKSHNLVDQVRIVENGSRWQPRRRRRDAAAAMPRQE
jgi:hypothetical protein